MTASELRDLREKAKVSRWELSERTDLSPAMIQRVEDGQKEMPADYESLVRKALEEITQERAALVAGGKVA